jgi:hypothetical protein
MVAGYILLIDIINTLPYIKSHPCSNNDFENLPHIIMTVDSDREPSSLDFQHDVAKFSETHDDSTMPDSRFNECGDYVNASSILPVASTILNMLQYDVYNHMSLHRLLTTMASFSSDTPSIDNGSTMEQFFCSTTSLVCNVYSMKIKKQFPDNLEHCIRTRSAPSHLLSNHTAVKTSARVKDIL